MSVGHLILETSRVIAICPPRIIRGGLSEQSDSPIRPFLFAINFCGDEAPKSKSVSLFAHQSAHKHVTCFLGYILVLVAANALM